MKRFFPVILLITFFAGCTLCSTKKVICPGFDDPLFDQWFPLSQNTLIRFKGPDVGDTLNFLLETVNESADYEVTRGGLFGDLNSCTATKNLVGRSTSNMNELFNISYLKDEIPSTNNQNSSQLSVRIGDNNWVARSINNNSISAYENNGFNVVDSSYNVNFSNGINYPVLATITNDTLVNKTSRYYRLFIAKGFGIIGFDEYPSNKRWELQ